MTKLKTTLVVFLCLGYSLHAHASEIFRSVLANGDILIQDMTMTPPLGWKLHQDAIADGTLIMGFANQDDYFTFYAKKQTGLAMAPIFNNGAQTLEAEKTEPHGPFNWRVMATSKTSSTANGRQTFFVRSFLLERDGYTYYGYGRTTSSANNASELTHAFLDSIRVQVARSLTGPDYSGKKYYFGFGDSLSGFMGNEVKYDIAHTNDIFTKDVGGGYIGKKLVGPGHSGIVSEWNRLKGLMTAQDMYVQYSSGHGSESGLMVGVSYNEIRDNALSYPAREIVIFTMACYSGNLVNAFNNKKSVWQNWQSQGRTLMVMASSRPDEESSTGPHTDPDEPNGPDGSAGSAFGHSLWKALIGYADGYVDGVKDGFISLGEIRDFTIKKTQDVGGHTPVHTGAYNASLIMNKVPSKAFLESLGVTSENLSDEQVMILIQELDREMRI